MDLNIKLFYSQIKEIAKLQMVTNWQKRWDKTDRGRMLYIVSPTVNIKKLSGNFYINQALTGHGALPEHQYRFYGKEKECKCGEDGTRNHILLKCKNYQDIRKCYFTTSKLKGLFLRNLIYRV